MATNWLRDKKNVEIDRRSSIPSGNTGVVQCLLEEVDNGLRRVRESGQSTAGRGNDAADYSWLTSAWPPSIEAMSDRDMSCRERWELEEMFKEVNAEQCGRVIREFRKKTTDVKSANELAAAMRKIVMSASASQLDKEDTLGLDRTSDDSKLSNTNDSSSTSVVKAPGSCYMGPSVGRGRMFLGSRFRGMAYALLNVHHTHKIAPDSDACPWATKQERIESPSSFEKRLPAASPAVENTIVFWP